MAEWKLLGTWTEDELASRLGRLASVPPSSPGELSAMPPEEGWRAVRSSAVVAHEPPGPPAAGGAFDRAWDAVEGFAFSDPGIVTAHFDPTAPLLGRHMLLELRVLGLRYLCGTVVGAVCDESGDGATVRGYRYDTLEGHVERGAEWFRLTKDHGSGEIHFEIEARWQPGDFPNRWSRVGFALLAAHYQERWHRRAHHRLATLAADPDAARPRPGRRLVHQGPEVALVRSDGRARGGAGVFAGALALGALTGIRSTAGLAAVAAARAPRGESAGETAAERWIAEPAVEAGLRMAAAGEAMLDKVPSVPPRTDPLPLAGRAVLGGLAGSLLARRRGGPVIPSALLAGGAAVAVAVAATRFRRRLTDRGIAGPLVGVGEDVTVFAGGRLLRSSLR